MEARLTALTRPSPTYKVVLVGARHGIDEWLPIEARESTEMVHQLPEHGRLLRDAKRIGVAVDEPEKIFDDRAGVGGLDANFLNILHSKRNLARE
jgi:hypothetical protein